MFSQIVNFNIYKHECIHWNWTDKGHTSETSKNKALFKKSPFSLTYTGKHIQYNIPSPSIVCTLICSFTSPWDVQNFSGFNCNLKRYYYNMAYWKKKKNIFLCPYFQTPSSEEWYCSYFSLIFVNFL